MLGINIIIILAGCKYSPLPYDSTPLLLAVAAVRRQKTKRMLRCP